MEGRGRAGGRARGRARGQKDAALGTSGTPAPSVGMGVGQAGDGRARSRSAHHRGGGDRPGGLQASKQEDPVVGAMAQLSISSDNGSNGNGAKPIGRGTRRGRRDIGGIVWTKPKHVLDKRGTEGNAMMLLANCFKVIKKGEWILLMYHVDFNPEEIPTIERKKLLRQNHTALGTPNYIFDGMQLYMNNRLPKTSTQISAKREDGSIYQIKIDFVKEVGPLDGQTFQILNILMRRCMEHCGLTLMGRNYFNFSQITDMSSEFQISVVPGYSTSIRQHESEMLLNVDAAHKVIRTETILQKEESQQLLGEIVMTKYNEKTYRIDDIAWNKDPTCTFPRRGKDIAYVDYYREVYQIAIRDLRQPLLMSKPKKRDLRRGMTENLYLIPELCVMTGLSDRMRSNFNMMKSLASFMKMPPDPRINALRKFNTNLQKNPQAIGEFNQWGLSLSSDLIRVQGRELPQEIMSQHGITFNYDRRKSDWSREMRELQLNMAVELQNWSCIFPGQCGRDAQALCETLNKVGRGMGMHIAQPTMRALQRDGNAEFVRELLQCNGQQLVVLILPNNRLDRYSAIKKTASVRMGIPTQCVLSKTLFRKERLMSVATKIAIQINCKLGGEVWEIPIPLKNCMFIGYDAYHDSTTRGASYGAVVASYSQNYTRYYGQVARHSNHEELTNNFCVAIKSAIQHYHTVNKFFPQRVFVFRDGVGEGQLEYVKEHEVDAIKDAFEHSITSDVKPRLTFIVVSKRIITRFFKPPPRPDNPLPGTVVDDVVTLPERYDFFLISQSVREGTVSPTSYNVIEDNSGLKPDHLQRLAYKLTHLYYNWQGTVRVPAPCLYAHKLAFITGTAIHDLPSRNLAPHLWYL